MKTCCEPIARAVIRQPSISRCGTRRMISPSLNVPGSDSSALTVRYVGLPLSAGMKLAFLPMAKKAPPRPRHDRGHVPGLNRQGIAMVEGDARRRAAAAEALDRPQRHLAVLGRLPRPDPELGLERLHHRLCPLEAAAD